MADPENNQYDARSSSAVWGCWAGWGHTLPDGSEELLSYAENTTRMTIFDDGADRAYDFIVNVI